MYAPLLRRLYSTERDCLLSNIIEPILPSILHYVTVYPPQTFWRVNHRPDIPNQPSRANGEGVAWA